MKQLQAIRGMNDLLPEETGNWQRLENKLAQLMNMYGYQEIRMPILESTELFKRSIGEVTDIVEKEMYTFQDRNGDSLTLRPEGTAGCVRAGIEKGLFYNQPSRLWYMGPMFRHERPQKGRYRQFYQLGVEAVGFAGPDIDAELILMSARLWRQLGISDAVNLEINSLGSSDARQAYRQTLIEYYQSHQDALDEDSQRRLLSNPLRILDSKNPDMIALNEKAPKLTEHLDGDSQAHFDGLRRLLDQAGLAYTVNPCLVRGLDYYNRTVFEWVGEGLGAQATVCAGGHYDGLVAQLGGADTPAIGFAIGIERLLSLWQQVPDVTTADVYLILPDEAAQLQGLPFAEQLRDTLAGVRVVAHAGGGSFKRQFKKADKSGAQLALILGEDEIAAGKVTLKYLREDKPQQTVLQSEVFSILSTFFNA